MADDDMRCEPILGEDGEVIAVARVSPDLDERGREALRHVVEAACRLAERESAADPGRADRQRAAFERIRDRSRRWRREDRAARRRAARAVAGSALGVLAASAGVAGLAFEWPWWLSAPALALGFGLGCRCGLAALREFADAARGER